MPIGAKVTLRASRMFDFMDRLFNVALPRVRDFRGISLNSFDGRGNYNMGVKEQLIFPEIDFEKVDIKTEFKSDNEFVSTLNYKDLIHQPVKKWKFKADLFNSIQLLEDNQSIYFNIHKISFYNKFNEISIECRLYDTMDTINSLNEKLFIAERKNKMLSSKNRKLRKTIEAYKSRKTVKFADKLKGFF